ncbi:hypothetical protein PRIPAC_71749 [Pristionchus pacificus]|uniref:Uncharacterized protein n=1 Tax=Pristionchus pacificus TaxID=54126 RepID=A0A2A6C8G3_PRIPA|nr:hypothetical protein PRIPAC_71749 [Pristionchus pacificus]|eukprot:PDM74390.1 hypothetical protein PRIPAC_41746 [Pristionchus pacificus]
MCPIGLPYSYPLADQSERGSRRNGKSQASLSPPASRPRAAARLPLPAIMNLTGRTLIGITPSSHLLRFLGTLALPALRLLVDALPEEERSKIKFYLSAKVQRSRIKVRRSKIKPEVLVATRLLARIVSYVVQPNTACFAPSCNSSASVGHSKCSAAVTQVVGYVIRKKALPSTSLLLGAKLTIRSRSDCQDLLNRLKDGYHQFQRFKTFEESKPFGSLKYRSRKILPFRLISNCLSVVILKTLPIP